MLGTRWRCCRGGMLVYSETMLSPVYGRPFNRHLHLAARCENLTCIALRRDEPRQGAESLHSWKDSNERSIDRH